jgi:mannosyltransferase OCH1-like enzyme
VIPKIFHLTYKNFVLPEGFQKNINIIGQLYPDHEIRIHDDNAIYSFVSEYFPEYYDTTFTKMPQMIMKVDAVRYMWMYVYGGIYCDMDIKFNKRVEFEDGVILFEREWTFPNDNTISKSIHNCCFASEPKQEIWLEILAGIAENVDGLSNKPLQTNIIKKLLQRANILEQPVQEVFNITGPNAISRIVSKSKLIDNVCMLPASIFYQEGFSKGTLNESYVIHETAGSWK